MRILVTGVTGFVAGHLVAELAEHGHSVCGTSRTRIPPQSLALDHHIPADLAVRSDVERLVRNSEAECIVHLAAQSNPAESWNLPGETFSANTISTTLLADEAGRQGGSIRRFVHVSSSDVYGHPSETDLPVHESLQLRPESLYAVSKCASEQALRLLALRHGLEYVVMRPFSHTGPGQSCSYVVPAFARKVALVESGVLAELHHGRLDTWRDFTDVRDVTRAYRLACESGSSGATYNVCSGRCISIRQILERLVGMSDAPIPTATDTHLVRSESATRFRGDFSATKASLGWEPQIDFQQTLKEVLEEQRRLVGPDRESDRVPL